jgi:hypothetical protein
MGTTAVVCRSGAPRLGSGVDPRALESTGGCGSAASTRVLAAAQDTEGAKMSTEKGPLAEVGPPGATDDTHNLVGLLYHTTHSAVDYDAYIAHAEKDADEELADFYREVRDQNAHRAMRAKQLLKKRL